MKTYQTIPSLVLWSLLACLRRTQKIIRTFNIKIMMTSAKTAWLSQAIRLISHKPDHKGSECLTFATVRGGAFGVVHAIAVFLSTVSTHCDSVRALLPMLYLRSLNIFDRWDDLRREFFNVIRRLQDCERRRFGGDLSQIYKWHDNLLPRT